MKKIPIGIIGCGYIAKKAFLPLLTTLPDVSINMILSQSSRNWDGIKSTWPGIKTTTSWNEFIRSDIQAAFVLTPVGSHYELCDRLLSEGFHVFVEKPPTISAEKTYQITQKAQEKNLVFMVGFNRRFAAPVLKAKERVKENQIRLLLLEKHRPFLQQRDLAESYREDLIHQVDLLNMFSGDLIPLETSAVEVDGNLLSAVSSLKMNAHGLGVIIHSRESGLWQERITIVGNERTLILDLFESVVEIIPDEKRDIWRAKPGKEWLDDRGFQKEILHFLHCINTGSKPITNGFEAARTQELQEQLVNLYYS